MENWLIGIVGALVSAICGGVVGHKLTIKLFNERSKLQKQAFWGEFELLMKRYSRCVPALINDYNNPLKNSYSGVPEFDMTIIDSLSTELCGSIELLNTDQRELIIGLKGIFTKIKSLSMKRNELFQQLISDCNESEIYQPMQFYTAQLLLDVIQIIFYTCKISDEKQNFTFGKYSVQDQAEVACRVSKIKYDKNFWQGIEQRLAAA
ncbi:hypothetical protein H5187_21110 [Pseudoalteromonas sp. SG44-1]|uniref:hypothetical protein n=1 Tax=Pseudoalteromonas sp. SG44-1 TaxID=2760964 RepID=UPI0016012F42|nr:hypothetical protein [Pseudoalteromonas sp. SG44-1]MBB1419745.1 hypothetical protein [Pseudoalteromonas sp. SG44-1]